jgi:hypothetical protein
MIILAPHDVGRLQRQQPRSTRRAAAPTAISTQTLAGI